MLACAAEHRRCINIDGSCRLGSVSFCRRRVNNSIGKRPVNKKSYPRINRIVPIPLVLLRIISQSVSHVSIISHGFIAQRPFGQAKVDRCATSAIGTQGIPADSISAVLHGQLFVFVGHSAAAPAAAAPPPSTRNATSIAVEIVCQPGGNAANRCAAPVRNHATARAIAHHGLLFVDRSHRIIAGHRQLR